MHIDAEERAFVPLSFQKGQRVWRCLSIICVRAGKFVGCEGFLPEFPQIPRKVIVQLLPTNFLQDISRPLFGVTSKKDLHVFFCKSWASFLHGFSGILRRFLAIKTFGGELADLGSNELLK